MALDIIPPNFAGTAALAGGGNGGNLNLQGAGALGLQALQQNQTAAAARRSAANELMQIQQAGALGLGQQDIARQQIAQQAAQQQQQTQLEQQRQAQQGIQFGQTLGMDQARLAQQGNEFGQTMGMESRKTAAHEQQNAVEAHKTEMVKLLEDKKETLRDKGAFASYARMALERATSPEEAQQITTEFLKEAVSKDYIKADQAKMIAQIPVSQRKSLLESMIINVGMADEFKKMYPDPKPGSIAGTEVYDPETGKLIFKSSPATKANITESQEKYLDAKSSLESLKPYENPPDNFFGLAAGKQDLNYVRELGKIIPGVAPSREDAEEMGKYKEFNANAKLNIMKTAKTLAGARFSNTDLEMIEQIMPQVGKSQTKVEYKAKMRLVKNFLLQAKTAREEILKTGAYQVGTQEYDDAFSAKLPTILEKAKETSASEDLFSQYRRDPAYKDWSDDKIKRALQGGK